jgi:hypothetical protein
MTDVKPKLKAVPPEIVLTEEGYEEAIEDLEPKQKN